MKKTYTYTIVVKAYTPVSRFKSCRRYLTNYAETALRFCAYELREWHDLNCEVTIIINGKVWHKDK